MWWNDYWPGPMIHFGPVFFIVVIFACGVMMIYMMRGRRGGHGGALEILKERFARGEIDRNEFEERRRLLEA
ncbi:MAG TPA: SHOCT domain-containing protein [Pseudolabrys sp.]|jgi:putative membrane protein